MASSRAAWSRLVYRPVVALAVAAASAETEVSLAASLVEVLVEVVEEAVAVELLLWSQAQRLKTRGRVSSAMASFFIMIQKFPF